MKKLLITVIILIIVAGAVFYFLHSKSKTNPSPDQTQIQKVKDLTSGQLNKDFPAWLVLPDSNVIGSTSSTAIFSSEQSVSVTKAFFVKTLTSQNYQIEHNEDAKVAGKNTSSILAKKGSITVTVMISEPLNNSTENRTIVNYIQNNE
jgi:hypothetical protein